MDNIAISNLPYINNIFGINNIINSIKVKHIELFIEPLDEEYHKDTIELLDILTELNYNISIHCPFRMVNLVYGDNSEEWKKTLWSFKEAIDIAEKYNASFIVLHTNEAIEGIEGEKELSKKHLREIVDYSLSKGVKPLIENVGINSNNLFSEEEFISLCINEFPDCNVLIDIGHAIINKWNLEKVLCTLGSKIEAFHIHNNNGKEDEHKPISEGILDYDEFYQLRNRYSSNSKIILEYGIGFDKELEEDYEEAVVCRKL